MLVDGLKPTELLFCIHKQHMISIILCPVGIMLQGALKQSCAGTCANLSLVSTGDNYITRDGKQAKGVRAMVNRLKSGTNSLF